MKHQHAFFLSVAVLMGLLIFAACSSDIRVLPTQPETPNIPSVAKGNGAPSGAHYNLNIIGVPKAKTADMDNNHGHRIFVKLWGKSKIWLALAPEGESFMVLDANGTDNDGAKFQLPYDLWEDELVTRYVVYARALGRPGGWSHTVTCYVDEYGDTLCSADTLELRRTHGKQKFVNVSKKLLTVVIDGARVGIFSDEAYQYFWDYDNHGLKLAQLRFYEITEDLSD